MPRRKRTTRNNRNDSILSVRSDANSTLASVGESVNSTVTSFDLNESHATAWYTELEEKIQDEIERIKRETAAALETLECEHQIILSKIPKNLLNKPVSLDDERIWEALAVLNSENVDSDNYEPSADSPVLPTTVKKRRSRSVKECEFLKPEIPKDVGLRRTTRIRSISVDAYQTPKNKVRLSALTTAKKYTVSKPAKKAEDSGINMKRFMRPDEEAISTSGSPLYVHSGATSTPHVNIPLPGGVVMSIEPRRPRGRLDVPEIDEQTRKQIKILCETLKNLAEQ